MRWEVGQGDCVEELDVNSAAVRLGDGVRAEQLCGSAGEGIGERRIDLVDGGV